MCCELQSLSLVRLESLNVFCLLARKSASNKIMYQLLKFLFPHYIVVGGRSAVRIERGHERAEKLFLHYIQRWAKDYLRRRLDWVIEDLYGRSEYTSNTSPRHLRSALCPCQYIEEHLRNKRLRESLNPCAVSSNPCHWCD